VLPLWGFFAFVAAKPSSHPPAVFLGLGTSGVIAAKGTFSLIFAHGNPAQ